MRAVHVCCGAWCVLGIDVLAIALADVVDYLWRPQLDDALEGQVDVPEIVYRLIPMFWAAIGCAITTVTVRMLFYSTNAAAQWMIDDKTAKYHEEVAAAREAAKAKTSLFLVHDPSVDQAQLPELVWKRFSTINFLHVCPWLLTVTLSLGCFGWTAWATIEYPQRTAFGMIQDLSLAVVFAWIALEPLTVWTLVSCTRCGRYSLKKRAAMLAPQPDKLDESGKPIPKKPRLSNKEQLKRILKCACIIEVVKKARAARAEKAAKAKSAKGKGRGKGKGKGGGKKKK